MPASMPELMWASRPSAVGCSTRTVIVVRPSCSVRVRVFREALPSGSGIPSYASVATIRSSGRISRNSPWKPPSNPVGVTITYRQVPPTLRSISQTVISPRSVVHNRRTRSGVVQACNTRSFGASNSRVIRICRSVGRVTVAVPLLVIAISVVVLSLEVFQNGIELLEALAPRLLVLLDPVVDGSQRLAVQPVEPAPAVLAHLDRPLLAQHP